MTSPSSGNLPADHHSNPYTPEGQRNAVFITYEELEDSEAARRERAARLEAEPRPGDVPYYRPGKPAPELLARYWHRRALRAEAELSMWREADRIRERNKQP